MGLNPKITNIILSKSLPKKCFNFQKLVSNMGRNVKARCCDLITKVIILSWDSHIHKITAKANKLLGLLRRTCPCLTDVTIRRTLYLSLVKSQLCYASEVWSPHIQAQNIQLEQVQRRARRWTLKERKSDSSYSERLSTLKLLPLCYDREIRDLVFFYKALYGISDLNVHDYVSFVSHNRTRLSLNPNLVLKTPFCKTTTYQASYFNRILKLWNCVYKVARSSTFSRLKNSNLPS